VEHRKEREVRNFQDLQVWQKAQQLALSVYQATAVFPVHEQYGLSSQMRRCCVSIPSNIAEGCGRGGHVELARYLQIARGSASELEYQLLLARDLNFLKAADYERLVSELTEVEKMLATYRQKVIGDVS
jgi:four helix bundle protein